MRRDGTPGPRADAARRAVLLVGVRTAGEAVGGGGRRRGPRVPRVPRARLPRHARVVRGGHSRVHALCCAVSIVFYIFTVYYVSRHDYLGKVACVLLQVIVFFVK